MIRQLIVGTAVLLATMVTVSADVLVVNGVAIQKSLGTELFYGGLLLEMPSGNADDILSLSRPEIMEVKVLSGISKRSWFSLWTQSVAINNPSDVFARNAESFSEILSAFKGGLVAGDVVRFVYSPGAGMKLVVNDVALAGNLPEEVFSLLLRSWLGPVPPSTAFKDALLGKNVGTDIYRRYQTLGPTAFRRSIIGQWVAEAHTAEVANADGNIPENGTVSNRVLAKQKAAIDDQERTFIAHGEMVNTVSPEGSQKFESTAGLTPDASAQPAQPASTGRTQVKIDNVKDRGGRNIAESNSGRSPDIETTGVSGVIDPGAEEKGNIEVLSNSPEGKNTAKIDNPEAEDLNFTARTLIAQQAYITSVRLAVYRQISYPLSALRRKMEGQLRVAVEVNSRGEVLNVVIVEASDFNGFNKEIVRAIGSAAPFSKFSADMDRETFTIETPFSFRLAR